MIRPLLESARVSNLPTVWTNVLVGTAAVGHAGDVDSVALLRPLLVATLAVSLFYTGGMLLNDAVDADWDREHKPDRPIPRGKLSRRFATWAAAATIVGGVLTPLLIGLVHPGNRVPFFTTAAWLVILIVAYDLLHKRSAWTSLLMGACRGMVYLIAASIAMGSGDPAGAGAPDALAALDRATEAAITPARAILFYIVLVTLAARREDIAGARLGRIWGFLLPLPYLIAAIAYRPDRLLWTIFVAAAFVGWTFRNARVASEGRIPQAVAGWLAGICLADATLLMLLDRLDLAAIAVGCWLLTIILQRTVPGT